MKNIKYKKIFFLGENIKKERLNFRRREFKIIFTHTNFVGSAIDNCLLKFNQTLAKTQKHPNAYASYAHFICTYITVQIDFFSSQPFFPARQLYRIFR